MAGRFALIIIIISLMPGILWAGSLKWYGFDEGYNKAIKEKKPIILDFTTNWCKWCHVMDKKTFNDPAIAKILKKDFILIRINPEKSKEQISYDGKTFSPMQFMGATGARGFPALVFFDKEGKIFTMLPGYVPAESFLGIITYVKDECYAKGLSFEDFQKKKGSCKEPEKKKKSKEAKPK